MVGVISIGDLVKSITGDSASDKGNTTDGTSAKGRCSSGTKLGCLL